MQRTKHGVFFRLMGYVRGNIGTLVVALLLVLIVTVTSLLRPIIIGNAIDEITAGSIFRNIIHFFVFYILLLIVGTAANMIQMWLLQKLGQKVIYRLRNDLFSHIHKLSLRFFDITPVGRIVTRVTNDAETLSQLFSTILVSMVKNIALIVGYAAVMLVLQWKLALLSFVLVPVVCYLTVLFTKIYRSIQRITRTRLSSLNTYLSENLSAMKLIQVFHREKEKQHEFSRHSQELFHANLREITVYGAFQPIIYWISILSLAIVLGFGGYLVLGGSISIGMLYIFSSYVKSFFDPIQSLSDQFGTLQEAMAAGEKVFTLLDEEPTVCQPETPKTLPNPKGSFEFDMCGFPMTESNGC